MTMNELSKKRKEYENYIINHRKNVINAYKDLLTNNNCTNIPWVSSAIREIMRDDIIKNHDISKYSEEEFEPYRSRFFPCDGEKYDNIAFEKAWTHHYKTNPHHWDHWIVYGVAQEMDDKYIIEMCCDWIAMSSANKNNNETALDWFKKELSNHEILLHENTEDKVFELLRAFYIK